MYDAGAITNCGSTCSTCACRDICDHTIKLCDTAFLVRLLVVTCVSTRLCSTVSVMSVWWYFNIHDKQSSLSSSIHGTSHAFCVADLQVKHVSVRAKTARVAGQNSTLHVYCIKIKQRNTTAVFDVKPLCSMHTAECDYHKLVNSPNSHLFLISFIPSFIFLVYF